MAASRRGRRRNRKRSAASGTSRQRRFSASRSKPPAGIGHYSPSRITVSPRSRRRRAPGCSRALAWCADRARRLRPDPAMSRCRTAPQDLVRKDLVGKDLALSRTAKRRNLKRGQALPRHRAPTSRGRATSTGKRPRSRQGLTSRAGPWKHRRSKSRQGPNRQEPSRREPSHQGLSHQELNRQGPNHHGPNRPEWKSRRGSRRRELKSRVRPFSKRVRRSSRHDRPPHRLRDRRSPAGRRKKSGSANSGDTRRPLERDDDCVGCDFLHLSRWERSARSAG